MPEKQLHRVNEEHNILSVRELIIILLKCPMDAPVVFGGETYVHIQVDNDGHGENVYINEDRP